MDVRVGLWRKLSAKELMLLNCGVAEDSWESLGMQGDLTIHSEGDRSWLFFGRNDAKSETPILWPPRAKSWLIGKDPYVGRDWGQEEKGTTEDEMAGWHHWLDGHEFEWPPGVGDGQGGLACCDSWGCRELDTTEWLNWTACLTCMQGTSCKMSNWMKHKLESSWPGEISTTSDMQMIPNGRNLRGAKEPLDNKITCNCFIEKLVTVTIVKQALFQKDAVQINLMIKVWLWSGVLEQSFNIFQE